MFCGITKLYVVNSAIILRDLRVISVRDLNSATKPEGWDEAKPFKDIPGFKPLPIVGNSWRYFVPPLSTGDFTRLQKISEERFGHIAGLRKIFGLPDMYSVYDPKESEKLLRSENTWPVREGFFALKHYRNVLRKEVFGDLTGLLNAQGQEWQDLRSAVNPIFLKPHTAKKYIGNLDLIANDFIKIVEQFSKNNKEMPADFDNEINKWAFESIGFIALDRRLGCLDVIPNPEAQKMISYMVATFKLMLLLDFTPLGKYCITFNLPPWKRFVKYQDFFTDMALKFLDEAEEKIKSNTEYNEFSENEKSVFEKLLKIDKKIAMVMTLDMLSAGIDTTGKLSSAILYYLAKNPEVQNKLRNELMTLMPTPSTPMTVEILNKAAYLKAVVKEACRFAPVASGIMRKTTKDIVLCGYQVPIGTTVIIPTLYLSLSEKHYHKPTEFIPDRWLKSTTDELSYKRTNPFITLPFGYGSRSCVGKRFANLEMEILTAKIVRNFVMEWPHADMRFSQEFLYGLTDPLKIHMKKLEE